MSQVTQLIITRPSSFNYKPGDYVFLNIPAIAKYEWHPFTISSAPQMSGGTLLMPLNTVHTAYMHA